MKVDVQQVYDTNDGVKGVFMTVLFETPHEAVALTGVMGGLGRDSDTKLFSETSYKAVHTVTPDILNQVTYQIFDALDDVVRPELKKVGFGV
jgi:hypothetical protein